MAVELVGVSGSVLVEVLLELLLVVAVELPPPQATNPIKKIANRLVRNQCFILSILGGSGVSNYQCSFLESIVKP